MILSTDIVWNRKMCSVCLSIYPCSAMSTSDHAFPQFSISKDKCGGYDLGERNKRGDRFVEWARTHEMIIGSTWFKQHPRCLWTWRSPDNMIKNQTDYILINKWYRNALFSVSTKSGVECNSDHIPVIGKMRIKLKNIKKGKNNIKLNLAVLKKGQLEGRI